MSIQFIYSLATGEVSDLLLMRSMDYERKVKIGSSLGKRHIAARGKKRNVSLHKKYGNVYFIN